MTGSEPSLETITAYHEAAHAVAHEILGYQVDEVTIASQHEDKVGHTQGDVLTDTLKNRSTWREGQVPEAEREVARDDILILLIGDYAEGRFLDRPYKPDIDNATWTDEREAFGRIVLLEEDSSAQLALLDEIDGRAQELLDDHWPEIECVAAALGKEKALDRDGVLAAMERAWSS